MKPKFKIWKIQSAPGLWSMAFCLLLIGIAVLWIFKPSIDGIAPLYPPTEDMRSSDFLPPEKAFQARFIQKQAEVELLLDIAPGYALYVEQLKVTLEEGHAQLGPLHLPPAQTKWDSVLKKEIQIYRLKQQISIPVFFSTSAVTSGIDRPAPEPLVLAVTLKGCADTGLCYAPIVYRERMAAISEGRSTTPWSSFMRILKISWAGLTDSQAAFSVLQQLDAQRESSLFLYGLTPLVFFALFFIFGALLSALPCSWPMIPIVSALILQSSKAHIRSVPSSTLVARLDGVRLSLAYVLGMASMYALFGVIAALAGKRFGVSTGQPWVQAALAAVIFVMAIILVRGRGFTFALLQRVAPQWSLKAQGRASLAFVIGALSALTLSPCMSAPLFGVLAFIAQTGHIGIGALTLFALGLGLGLPLIVMGMGLSTFLPRSGAWMRHVQRGIGMVLLGMAVYLAIPAVMTLLQAAGWQQKALVVSDAPRLRPASRELIFQPVHTHAQLQAAVHSSKKITLLEVYADNCSACRKIEDVTLLAPEVCARLRAFNLLRLDVSKNSPPIAELLKHFALYGPPALLFFDANGHEISTARRVGYITPEALVQILKNVQRASVQNRTQYIDF